VAQEERLNELDQMRRAVRCACGGPGRVCTESACLLQADLSQVVECSAGGTTGEVGAMDRVAPIAEPEPTRRFRSTHCC